MSRQFMIEAIVRMLNEKSNSVVRTVYMILIG